MGVANTKSTGITNGDARDPRIVGSSWFQGAQIDGAVGTVEVAAADDNDSVYRLVRVSSSVRPHSLRLLSDAITAGTAFHVGLYNTLENGGTEVDADFFAASLDLSAGNTVPVEVLFANLYGVEDIEKRLWEALDLTADPFKEYDICLTGATVGSGAGTISLIAEWVK
jgi:hypothetical protein